MKTELSCLLWLSTCLAAPGAEPVLFQDNFKGKLGPGWTWLREAPEAWRVGERGLEVRMLPGNMWGGANNAQNVLVRPTADPAATPQEITLTLTNQPTSQYEQVDLVWYYDDSNMVKLGQELVNGKLCIVMGREQGDKTRTIVILPLDSFTVSVRFNVKGNEIQGLFKTPAMTDWREAGKCDLPIKGDPKISLQFYQGPKDIERWARVSELTVRKLDKD